MFLPDSRQWLPAKATLMSMTNKYYRICVLLCYYCCQYPFYAWCSPCGCRERKWPHLSLACSLATNHASTTGSASRVHLLSYWYTGYGLFHIFCYELSFVAHSGISRSVSNILEENKYHKSCTLQCGPALSANLRGVHNSM